MKKIFYLVIVILFTTHSLKGQITFLPNGNAGIGTNAPTEKFEVVGSLRYSMLLKPGGNAGTANQVLMNIGGNSNAWTTLTTSHIADFSTAVGQYMKLTGGTFTGNLTLNPAKTIRFVDMAGTYPTQPMGLIWDVNNDGALITATQSENDKVELLFQLSDNADVNDKFIFKTKDWQGANADVYQLYMDGTKAVFNYPDWHGTTGTSKNFDFYIMGNNRPNKNLSYPLFKTVAATNRVGINTGDPTETLEVNGNIKITGTSTILYGENNSRTEFRNDAGSTSSARSGFYQTAFPTNYPKGATSWWHLIESRHSSTSNNYALQIAGSFYDQKLYFRKTNNLANQAWSELVTVDTLGRVKFDNDLAVAKKSVIVGGSTYGGAIKFSANSTTANNRNLELGNLTTAGVFSTAMTVSAENGNVAIGSAVQSNYKLAVGGTILAGGVTVKLWSGQWPDFVFSPKYKLKPLQEVAKYIAQNEHLPDVPSASQVQEKGIELAEMNAKLLQKIEELTLYMIEMQKNADKQSKEIMLLQKQINSLQKVKK